MGIDWKPTVMIPVGVIAQGGATVPTAPTSFTATPSIISVSLSWAAPSNNGGLAVTSYTLKRGATTIYTGSGTSFSDTGLTASTGYSYTVLATNSLGNGPTAAVSTTTLAKIATTTTHIAGSTSYIGYVDQTFGPNTLRLTNTSTGAGIAGKLIYNVVTDANGYAEIYYGPFGSVSPGTDRIEYLEAGVHSETDTTLGSSSGVTITFDIRDPL